MKKNNFETQPREISEEELAAALASLSPIEVPEGPLTNSGEKCVIQVDTIAVDELSIKSHAKKEKSR